MKKKIKSQKRLPDHPVEVFWREEGSGKIGSSFMSGIEPGRIRFTDGGWNPIESCYLSAEQARKHPERRIKQLTDDAIKNRVYQLGCAANALVDLIGELTRIINR